ncbi:aminotransferase class I/II-fold pyridoxal phosphate-dependent enzyme [Chitinophaga oryzae]|uniref:Aminotransferase class I/II-fold pyridoxal phosphate-dependent enzyme n=1 Tax=Chitinophaga oryzae TaxID=2725414 RepID=A0AAE6ZFX9_9BACT|nr:aminotransferase class I/II-fold pyridoxal phosphate-dependent enzyme [Chitinophaga oryzae]QJB31117.1 aminotransferase class I/II-fold pyridoxal phosphate-dependent enzyme [Chitinophaga oryzae]
MSESYGEKNPALENALSKSTADFYVPDGRDVLSRMDAYYSWVKSRVRTNTWQYSRTQTSRPGPVITATDAGGRQMEGVNFASQDYLGLSAHPDVLNAAQEALLRYGPHSAGSPMFMGQTDLVPQLEEKLQELTGMEHVLIFPTGWAAGFSSLTGLVRKNDYIVMDRLAHACLRQGAYAATANVFKFDHLDHEDARKILASIRAKDAANGILVVSEGLFSMNADTPDIRRLQEICHEFGARLLMDVAHDLGATGPEGSGQLGIQGMKGRVDLVMGSFSKTFAANGGFIATHSAAVKEYLKMYAGPYLFSNAVSPVQTAAALQGSRIITAPEGAGLRKLSLGNTLHMRARFASNNLPCLGIAAPIVLVPVGGERHARLSHSLLMKKNIAAMIVEYPVVPMSEARIRLQLMSTHTIGQINHAVDHICEVLDEVRKK